MSNHKADPFDLEALFEAEKHESLEPSGEFLARIIADATLVQNDFESTEIAPIPDVGFWMKLRTTLGGWPTLAGLATATIAGVWIGVSPPQGLDTLTDAVLGESFGYSDYLPSFDSVLAEG